MEKNLYTIEQIKIMLKPFLRYLHKIGISLSYSKIKKNNFFPILCFHKVSEIEDKFYPAIKPKLFEELIIFLNQKFHIVNLDEILSYSNYNYNLSKPTLAITFDDGYYEFMNYAFPILERQKTPFNINVIVGSLENKNTYGFQSFSDYFKILNKVQLLELCRQIGFKPKNISHIPFEENYKLGFSQFFSQQNKTQQNDLVKYFIPQNFLNATKMLNWEDVINISNLGYSIGTHGYNHYSMDLLDEESLIIELNSKLIIEKKIQKKVEVLAFPCGRYNTNIVRKAIDFGYQILLTNSNKLNLINHTFIKDRILMYGNNIDALKSQSVGAYYNFRKIKYFFFKN